MNDDRRNLIAEAHLLSGSPCQGVVHPRAIVRLALKHDATALLLVYNHVNQDPPLSENDVARAIDRCNTGFRQPKGNLFYQYIRTLKAPFMPSPILPSPQYFLLNRLLRLPVKATFCPPISVSYWKPALAIVRLGM